jgi:mannose-6-phosphate isomerase-like protein (cupin superfamily)
MRFVSMLVGASVFAMCVEILDDDGEKQLTREVQRKGTDWREGKRLPGEAVPVADWARSPSNTPPPPARRQSHRPASLTSEVVRVEDAVPTRGPWGEWRRYFRGETLGTRDMTVLAVTLKPGQEPHPPHQHAQEEFMILAEGHGVWHLDGKEIPARKGDAVYAAPWAMHGIKNTSDAPLVYYMIKWSNKGVSTPPAATETAKTDKPAKRNPPAILGAWEAVDRHIAMGSLYQPVHGVRKRKAKLYFAMEGDQIAGHAIMAGHAAISFQERWKDGRTDFRLVRFSEDQLVFEFDIDQWRREAGPLAVEDQTQKNAGRVRVEARLQGDRLVGTWRMFLANGTEVFRGEWEARRDRAAKPAPEQPPRK